MAAISATACSTSASSPAATSSRTSGSTLPCTSRDTDSPTFSRCRIPYFGRCKADKQKKAETPLFQPSLHADKARFELAEGFALTRFRGVLLRPLGHLSIRHLKTSNLIIVPQWWRLSNRTGCNGVISGVSCFAPDCASLGEQRFVEGRIAPIKRQFDTVRNQTGKHAQGLRSRIRRLFCIGDA